MKMVMGLLLLAVLVATHPTPVSAQAPWDSPLLIGPASPGGISFFLIDPGEGLGAMGQWQASNTSRRVGFRVGLAETHDDRTFVFGGIDFTGHIHTHSTEFPLDVIWVTGLGIGVRDDAILTIPMGVSMGRLVPGEGLSFHPYLTPRLVVDAYLGDDDTHRHGHDDLDLGFALDLGADFSFTGGWAIRVGASVGDRDGVAIGFSVPAPG